jgi:hypothetical protein
MATSHAPQLAEALHGRTLALFIGADLPRQVTGLPSRADLARELAHRKGGALARVDESLSLAEVAQRVSQAGKRWEFTAFIRDALDTAGRPPQPFHRRIVELANAHRIETIITTVYDNLLELAFQEAGAGINRVVRGSDVSFVNPDRPTLIKLYGDAQQPDTLVVTDRDHSDLLRDRDREPLLDEVRRALRLNSVLFLGYNLADPDFRFLFDQIAESRFARIAYAVWPGLPEADVRMWRDRGIVILDTDPFGILGKHAEMPVEVSSITLSAPSPSEEPVRERRHRSHLIADNCPDVIISFDFLLKQTENNDPHNWAGVRLRGKRKSRDGYFVIVRGNGHVEIILVKLGSEEPASKPYVLPRESRAMRLAISIIGTWFSVESNGTEIMSCEADQHIDVGGVFFEVCRATAIFSNPQIEPRRSNMELGPPEILDNRVKLIMPASHTEPIAAVPTPSGQEFQRSQQTELGHDNDSSTSSGHLTCTPLVTPRRQRHRQRGNLGRRTPHPGRDAGQASNLPRPGRPDTLVGQSGQPGLARGPLGRWAGRHRRHRLHPPVG